MTYRIYTNTKDKNGKKIYVKNNDTDVFTAEELIDALRYDSKLAMNARIKKWFYTIEPENNTTSNSRKMKNFTKYLKEINITDDEIEKERVKRIKMLKLESLARKDAIENKTFWISENTGWPWNINYYLHGYSYEKEVQEAINEIKKLGGTPYFAIVDHLKDGGLWISVLYISPYKNEWNREKPDKDGIVFAAVYNTSFGAIDYGDIQIHIDKSAGSVKRIA